jgi:hypothetical protein
MINENMKKVLVALRSGEFTQTRNTLQNSRGHCCLGVMCEVYEKETGDKLSRDVYGLIVGGNLISHQKVRKWVGLKNPRGLFQSKNKQLTSLAALNDVSHYNFLQIADYIETNPAGLLV